MRHATGLLCVLAISSLASAETGGGSAKAPPPKMPQPPPAPATLSETSKMLEPIQVESLTLTPIVATPAALKDVKDAKSDALLVLDEAMAGKQDRIIGRNTVIPANTTQAVPVYCVEHGRWDGTTKEFSSGKALAHNRLRGRASYAAQRDVWNEVAAKNVARKTKTASDTYRGVAQQQSDGTLGAMEKQVNAALAQIAPADRERMVGYAVALNGAVATVDLFGSPALFRKLETKLVRSYLTEAVDLAAKKDIKPPSAGDVKAFMADADKAAEQKSYDTEAAETVINAGARAYKAKVEYKRKASAATPAADTKPSPTVYQNYQAH
jgi:hypothetical protein